MLAPQEIAQRVIEMSETSKGEFRSHLARALSTAVVGLLTMIFVVTFLRFGPDHLSTQASAFAVFLLFVGASLLMIGVLTAAVPFGMTKVQRKLHHVRIMNEYMDVKQRLVLRDQEVETLLTVYDEIREANDIGPRTEAVIRRRDSQITEIRTRHLVGTN